MRQRVTERVRVRNSVGKKLRELKVKNLGSQKEIIKEVSWVKKTRRMTEKKRKERNNRIKLNRR